MKPLYIILSAIAITLALICILLFRQQAIDAEEKEKINRDKRAREELQAIKDGVKKIDDDFEAAMKRIDAEERRAFDRINSISKLNQAKRELAEQLEIAAKLAENPADAEAYLKRAMEIRDEISRSLE